MNDSYSNGVQIRAKPALNIDEWEIAYDGQLGFIGVVVPNAAGFGPDDNWITMKPVFAYVSNPNVNPMPDGRVLVNGQTRLIFQMEFMASEVGERFQPTRRRRLADYHPADKKVFENLLTEALDNRDKLLAARGGLTLETEIPKGLQRPG